MFKMASQAPMYDQNAVQPMRDALIAVGFSELLTAKDVEEAIDVEDNKTTLVIISLLLIGFAGGFYAHRYIATQKIKKVAELRMARGFQTRFFEIVQVDDKQKSRSAANHR